MRQHLRELCELELQHEVLHQEGIGSLYRTRKSRNRHYDSRSGEPVGHDVRIQQPASSVMRVWAKPQAALLANSA